MPHPTAPSSAPTRAVTTTRQRSRIRWSIIGLSALGLTIAYLDRAAISVSIPFISKDFHISSAVKGVVLLLAIVVDSLVNPRDEQTSQQGDL